MSDPKDHFDPANPPEEGAENVVGADTPWGEGSDPAANAGNPADTRIGELEAEVADLKDRLLRAVADAENTRKRAERDKQDASKYAMTSFARDVLSVGDNLRRAIDSLSDTDKQGVPEPIRNLIEGVEMTEREFLSVLERHGVKAINPLGEKFDANLHQAMFEIPDPSQPNGTIMEVVATGYVIGDRLLRPAMVGVSKGGGAAPAPQASAQADAHGDAPAETDHADDAAANPGSKIDTKA